MGTINKNSDKEWIKHRYVVASMCIVFVFSVLLLRLVYLQMIRGEEYRRLSMTNCVRLKSIKSSRGLIYDRNRILLVDNRPAFDLTIVLEDAKPLKQTLDHLAELTGDSCEDLTAIIEKEGGAAFYKPLVLKRDITRDLLAAIEAHQFDLPGIHIDIEPSRNYIHKKTAAHLIGYLGEINKDELDSGKFPNVRSGDSIGRYGVEKSFEADLQGKRGGHQLEVDVNGRVIKILKTVEPVSGNDLVLTIDLPLQQKAEGLLGENDGAVVALDPSNGDVLVMASSPSFDQNDFIGGISSKKWQVLRDDPGRPMNNKAIQAEYPPASTYKIITALAGLEEKVIDRNSTFFCPGFYKFGNRRYHCWSKYGHGTINVVDAIAQSCDVFFYQTGEKLGVDALAKYAQGSGLGRLTGIPLAHERPGLIPTSAWKKQRFKEPWQAGETLSISIGQGFNLVTPLQMAVFISAVGNNGTLYRPRLVKSVQDAKGQVIREIEPEITGGLPASKKNLAIVRQGLLEVVHGNRGTARQIRLPDVQIAGKTGTAQVFSRKAGEKFDNKKLKRTLQDHAWFVCYAPAQDPKIAIAVIIEHGEHGSSAAAPVAQELIHAYFGDPEVPTAVVEEDPAHVE
ncbi:penicillin-binding protein 2 [Desulfobacter postgatei]|uniref:Penicillin-binding protein 2 n=1 Tax=Desulfobacter postgatei 2ac9 TaxID=879212 RepID=I5B1V8_9BACT|nr:penicillin-binding protein 2 [Desulfobacter postgatei]EIM63471.1 penicillin-binding protein 2 [Desulfobacter postgatei 2ac9]